MDVDDKGCEQVSMTMLSEVYPKEVIERCVQQSEPWSTKVRRVRLSTALTLALFVSAMALWSRRNQCQVWQSLVGKLSDLHPAEPKSTISDAGLSGRRQALGSQGLQALMRERCQLIAQPSSMPSAFFGRYRLMAIDGTVFNTADTKANAAAFGRSSNQYGPGAYPQVRGVLLAECGPHAVVGLQIDGYEVSEVHGAHRLLEQVGANMLVLVDAGITSGGFLQHARERRAHVLGALEAGAWGHLSHQRRLSDGSVLAWVGPTRKGSAHYLVREGMWVRIILAEAAVHAEVDPDRLSFTEGLFELTEMISLALVLEPEEATEPLLERLRHKMAQHVLPARRLRINRREVKQVYNKYKPKKRHLPPPEPFDPQDQFLDFVLLLDPLASELPVEGP